MQSIIELLYKGDIRGVSLKLPADRRDKELSYYDKIKSLMVGENAKLFDEYADTVALNYEFLIERAYAVAFKTGFLLGLEDGRHGGNMKLNLQAVTKEEQKVKAYLEANASEVLAEKINSGVRIQKDGKTLINKKTLAGFMRYACGEAKKQAEKGASSACIDDDTVYGWAIHYFEENSIEGTLYNEDGTEYKKQPGVATKAPTVKYTPPKPQPKPQMSMFDLLDAKPEESDEDEPTDEEIREAVEQIAAEEPPQNVDLETGEILTEEEMREFDGDVEEPDFADDEPDLDLSAFDTEALAALDELLGNEITMR